MGRLCTMMPLQHVLVHSIQSNGLQKELQGFMERHEEKSSVGTRVRFESRASFSLPAWTPTNVCRGKAWMASVELECRTDCVGKLELYKKDRF